MLAALPQGVALTIILGGVLLFALIVFLKTIRIVPQK